MKALKQRSIDWAEACEGVPAEDFLEDMPLPAQLDEAVEVFCSAIERETFVTWEAVIRQEQGLALSKAERKQLRSLISLADEEDDRVLWIDDLPRPRGPWYETLRTLAEALRLDVIDTVDCPAQVHEVGWDQLVEALDAFGASLRLPEGATDPLEVVPEPLRDWLEVQSALTTLCGLGQSAELSLEVDEQRECRVAWLLDRLSCSLDSLRRVDMTVRALLARLRMPSSEADLLQQALLEELELASPDEPIAGSLESWANSPESEIFRDLQEGPGLSRERAAEIVARGAEYLPDLIQALECEETPSHEKWAAVWLVGAIGDPSAVPVLKSLLVDPSSYDLATLLGSVADGAGRALAEMGPAGADALFDLLAERQAREVILESLSTLATREPDLRPRVAAVCLEVLADPTAPEMARYLAVKTLIALNWREALPVIERLLNRGELDAEMMGPESIEEWRLAPDGLPQHPEADCLERFTPLHRRAFEAHRARIRHESPLRARSQEGELQRDLAGLRSKTVGPKVGRNDPCPCGSGRKYKKCHLDTPLGTDLRRRAAAAPWPIWGYAMLPSEQLEQLGEEAVAAHLDILEMSGARLHEAAFHLTDDYLRWAVVAAARSHGERGLDWLIARIAVSGQSHPALDYASILAVALSPMALGLSELCVRERLVDLALEHGGLEQAWRVAAQTLFEDPALGHALFHRIECSHAHNPWTALAMADSIRGASSEEVVHALERAAATVRSGLASEPCPIEVVEAYLEDHRALLARGRLRRGQKWIWGDGLRRECRNAVVDLGRERLDLDRRLRTDLEDVPDLAAERQVEYRQALEGHLDRCLELAREITEGRASRCSDAPLPVLVARVPEGMCWLLSDAALGAALRVASSLTSKAQAREWRGFQRLDIPKVGIEEGLWQAARRAGLTLLPGEDLSLADCLSASSV